MAACLITIALKAIRKPGVAVFLGLVNQFNGDDEHTHTHVHTRTRALARTEAQSVNVGNELFVFNWISRANFLSACKFAIGGGGGGIFGIAIPASAKNQNEKVL